MTTVQAETIFTNWLAQLASNNIALVDSQDNVNILIGFIRNKCAGEVSRANLDKALTECSSVLKFEEGKAAPNPSAIAKAQADRDAKKIQAMRRQEAGFVGKVRTEFDKVEPQQNSVYTEAKQKAADAKAKQLQAELDRVISTYSVNSVVGRVNWAKTEQHREILRGIQIKNGNAVDWQKTLDAVHAKIQSLTFGQ